MLDLVASLLDKSLLLRREQNNGEMRLSMLETLREFALECLEQAEDLECCQQAYWTYYLTYIRHLNARTPLLLFSAPIEEIEIEYANLRVALQMS